MAAAQTMVAIPPDTTETVTPTAAEAKSEATRPASISPSCGPPMKKIMLTEVMRPRSASGVMSWRSVWRITVETRSARPVEARASEGEPVAAGQAVDDGRDAVGRDRPEQHHALASRQGPNATCRASRAARPSAGAETSQP